MKNWSYPQYHGVPFDYEDFINYHVVLIENNIRIIEDLHFMYHPATIQMLKLDARWSLFQLKVMLNIPDNKLKWSKK